MISNDSIGHGKVFRANGKVSPVGLEYPGSIGVAIHSFCEAGGTLTFVGQEL